MKFNIRKFRKNMLKLVNGIMVAVFIMSELTLDSPTWIPTITGFVSGLWLVAVTSYISMNKQAERGGF